MRTAKNIVWQSLAWPSIEVLQLTKDHGIFVHSVVVGQSDSHTPFAVEYNLHLTAAWALATVTIKSLLDNRTILLTHRGEQWFDGSGSHLAAFDGVPFIDISLSPFTNTLPIRCLAFEHGARQKIDLIYLDLPAFTLKKVQQYYSKLDNKIYRYQDIEIPDFVADITVDNAGLVVTYPGLFKRIDT